MVRITEELVRKKAEHNECIIGTLEELSLHQEDVEKIEHLGNWCKELQILYLQANLIPKIENLHKLKKLQYLNLAINNIEKVENLDRCESLEKLDLTLNFIGDLESVGSLRRNIFLKELYLTGNPCCDFQGYREYVIVVLPQLQFLDRQDITKSERIKAQQHFQAIEANIKKAQKSYFAFREEQKRRLALNNTFSLDDETFWKTASENSPETRREIAQRSRKNKEKNKKDDLEPKREYRLFTKEGRPLNVNQAKIPFLLNDEFPDKFILDIAVYKHLDTSLVEVDVQPIYVKVTIKGKVFQIVLSEEILTDKSTAQRSQTTGHLVITMPKAYYKKPPSATKKQHKTETVTKKPEYLEVTENNMDFSKIVENNKPRINIDVPPLEYA